MGASAAGGELGRGRWLIGEELESEDTPKRRAALDRMLGDFVSHIGRLDYAGRLAAGEAIGSGVVEGAAKTLGLRLKGRGARWRHKKPVRWRPDPIVESELDANCCGRGWRNIVGPARISHQSENGIRESHRPPVRFPTER